VHSCFVLRFAVTKASVLLLILSLPPGAAMWVTSWVMERKIDGERQAEKARLAAEASANEQARLSRVAEVTGKKNET